MEGAPAFPILSFCTSEPLPLLKAISFSPPVGLRVTLLVQTLNVISRIPRLSQVPKAHFLQWGW